MSSRAESLSARVEELEVELDDVMQRLRMEDEDATKAASESHASTDELQSENAELRKLLAASDVSAEATEVQMKERSDMCRQLQQDNFALELRLQQQQQQLQQQQQQLELLQQQFQSQQQHQISKDQKEHGCSPPPQRNRKPSFSDFVAGADSLLLNFTGKAASLKSASNSSPSNGARMGSSFEQSDFVKYRCLELLRRVWLLYLVA
jgi:hypothetical protein